LTGKEDAGQGQFLERVHFLPVEGYILVVIVPAEAGITGGIEAFGQQSIGPYQGVALEVVPPTTMASPLVKVLSAS
jgi:hypothetical protein